MAVRVRPGRARGEPARDGPVAEPAPPSDVRPFGRRRVVAMAVGLLLPPTVLFLEGLDGEVDPGR